MAVFHGVQMRCGVAVAWEYDAVMPVRARFGPSQTLRIGIQFPAVKTQADNG
jgi:hypothetical protein